MLYIFWSLLNLCLAAGFLVICFYAVKLIKIRYGFFITLIFVVGLLSFISTSANDDESKKSLQTLDFHGGRSSMSFHANEATWSIPDTMAKHYVLKGNKKVIIHENSLFKIWLHISYGAEAISGRIEPVHSYTSFEGLHSGVEWKPVSPLVNADESGKKIDYEVNGVMKWKLLNMGIYSEGKNFSGSIVID